MCTECGRIEEFRESRIEELQELVAKKKGFQLLHHSMRLFGLCPSCARKRERSAQAAKG